MSELGFFPNPFPRETAATSESGSLGWIQRQPAKQPPLHLRSDGQRVPRSTLIRQEQLAFIYFAGLPKWANPFGSCLKAQGRLRLQQLPPFGGLGTRLGRVLLGDLPAVALVLLHQLVPVDVWRDSKRVSVVQLPAVGFGAWGKHTAETRRMRCNWSLQ